MTKISATLFNFECNSGSPDLWGFWYWSSGRYDFNSSHFRWMSRDEPFTFTHWGDTFPKNQQLNECDAVSLWWDGWWDEHCVNRNGVLCEAPDQ